jgi:tetratricopeptide (TPR) repeat protein
MPPSPNPPPPLVHGQESTFDQTRVKFDSNVPKQNATSIASDTCLFPPFQSVQSPTVALNRLQVPPKAKKEYQDACSAIKDKKFDMAEKHLRKAVQENPKYSVAWVTLGQLLAAQNNLDEGRKACTQAAEVDSSYVPAQLCLADVAARTEHWEESLKYSDRALEIDPTSNAVGYSYNALANLNLHRLPEAEKNALRALELDKNHNDPRIHFLLAQIYEAKGQPVNEAAQLREYLKFATDPSDAAMVKQSLAEVEARINK